MQDLQLGEDNTLHMVLEPAKNNDVTVILPSLARGQLTFSNDSTCEQVLHKVHENKMISRPIKDYLIKYGDKELDRKLPLHKYNIEKGAGVLKIVPYKINLQVIDEYSNKLCVLIDTKSDTALDIKQHIIGNCNFILPSIFSGVGAAQMSKEYTNTKRMKLFAQTGKSYNLLEDDCLVKNYGLENNGELYMIYYDWDDNHEYEYTDQHGHERYFICAKDKFRLGRYVKLSSFAHGSWGQSKSFTSKNNNSYGNRSTLSLALRMQEQFDIPVENIEIYHRGWENGANTMQNLPVSPYQQYDFAGINDCMLIVDTKATLDDPWAKGY